MYISVIALAVASVSMSVAWYATSRTLYVNSINIAIDADRDLEISLAKDSGYVDHIEHTQLEADGVFMPLTSAHSSLWTSEKKDSPIFYDESNASDVEHFVTYRESKEGYFSKKIYLKADDDLWITVDPTKTFIKPNELKNAEDAEKIAKDFKELQKKYEKNPQKYEHAYQTELEHLRYFDKREVDLSQEELTQKILTRMNDVVKAMRFSLLIKDGDEYSYTIIDPNYEEETVLGGLLDNAYDQYYDCYLKDNTVDEFYERVYGEYTGELVYDEPDTLPPGYKYPDQMPSAFNAQHKPGVKTFNQGKSEAKGFEFKKEGALDLEDFKKSVPPFHFKVKRDTPKEIVVSLYLEGWDKDSVNYTMGARFFSDLTFKIEREMI